MYKRQAFTDLTPAILNEFVSRIEVHERDKKRAKQAIQHISIYFNYIGRFENEVTQLAEPTEQEIRQMREKIEEAQKEKSRAYHRNYSREYRARNLEKQREYDLSLIHISPCCDLVFSAFIQLSVYREQGVIVQCRERFGTVLC